MFIPCNDHLLHLLEIKSFLHLSYSNYAIAITTILISVDNIIFPVFDLIISGPCDIQSFLHVCGYFILEFNHEPQILGKNPHYAQFLYWYTWCTNKKGKKLFVVNIFTLFSCHSLITIICIYFTLY
jgi:hypothetical protein